MVSALLSGAGFGQVVMSQVPLFLWFYGPDMGKILIEDVILQGKAKHKEHVKQAVDRIKTLQAMLCLYVFPISYMGAMALDKFGNEIASSCTHSLDCSENTKNIIFFLTKNLVRGFVFLDSNGLFPVPVAGHSDYPDDFVGNSFAVAQPKYHYEIHLMWLNNAVKGNHTFVFPPEDRHNTPVAEHVFNWSRIGMATSVSFWYDARFTTPEQVEATNNLFAFHNLICGKTCAPVQLQDITGLDFYKDNQDTFSQLSRMPDTIWAVTDLMRVGILNELITACNDCIMAYQDIDNIPLNKKLMLDERTMKNLHRFGIVLHDRNGFISVDHNRREVYPENSMIIMSKVNHDPSLYNTILKKNIESLFEESKTRRNKVVLAQTIDFVFGNFMNMLAASFRHLGISYRAKLPTKCTPTIDDVITEENIHLDCVRQLLTSYNDQEFNHIDE